MGPSAAHVSHVFIVQSRPPDPSGNIFCSILIFLKLALYLGMDYYTYCLGRRHDDMHQNNHNKSAERSRLSRRRQKPRRCSYVGRRPTPRRTRNRSNEVQHCPLPTLCYAIMFSGRNSSSRAGFRTDSNPENLKIGRPKAGRRTDCESFPTTSRPKSGPEARSPARSTIV